jgi:Mg2+-importing ATPase
MKHFTTWTSQDVVSVFKQLETSLEGITSLKVQERLEKFGLNHIDIKAENIWSLFIRQFRSPFNYLLIIAAGIEFLISESSNAILILVLTILNVCIGFFQEYKAYCAILQLHRFIPDMTTVVRDGKEMSVPRDSLVPGDVIILVPGLIVPADARIVEGEVFIDESTLTGEAEPINKNSQKLTVQAEEIFQATNIVFAGTGVVGGRCKAVVIATGSNTIFYTITAGSSSAPKISGYEKGLLALSHIVMHFVIVSILLIFVVKQLLHTPISIAEELVFFITLIVAIVPEALPTVIAFSLSQGALRLAKNNIVVKRLTAIDDLGDIEILCTDKTGTITELRLTVDAIISTDPEYCLLLQLMDTKVQAQGITGKGPFDDVLLSYARQQTKDTLNNYTVLATSPFDSFRMRSTILVRDADGNKLVIVKGAPEIVLGLSQSIDGSLATSVMQEKIRAYGRVGKRTLAVACKQVTYEYLDEQSEQGLHFVGFVALNNPIKPSVTKTIELARDLGVQVKMITGDSKEVAGYVGKQIGLVERETDVITGSQLTSLSAAEFKDQCLKHAIFARIDPETKAHIIEALQEMLEVGFMGEGINDVPALKKANVAIVVQEASDIARSVADIVLLKHDLHVVVSGIRQGRITFSNINKYILCTLSGNFGNYYSLAFFSLLVPFLPMLPTQILLINLLSDLPLIAIASDRVDKYQIRRPKSYSISKMLPLMLLLGFVGSLSDVIFFAYFYDTSPAMFRSLWFVLNMISDVVLIYSIRTSKFFIYATRPSSLLLLASILSIFVCFWLPYSTIGQEWFAFVPPSILDMAKVIGIVVVYAVMTEFFKIQYFKYLMKSNNQTITL